MWSRTEVHKPCTAHSVRWCVLLCRARVHGMERPGPSCSWWGEDRCSYCCLRWVLWVRETDDLPATVWWGEQVRHSQFAHLHSALHACRNLVHIWSRRYCRRFEGNSLSPFSGYKREQNILEFSILEFMNLWILLRVTTQWEINILDLMLSRRWLWMFLSSGMWRSIVW
jgi:hypothetical protein